MGEGGTGGERMTESKELRDWRVLDEVTDIEEGVIFYDWLFLNRTDILTNIKRYNNLVIL